jgi:AAA+ superfamily predicted ATPase
MALSNDLSSIERIERDLLGTILAGARLINVETYEQDRLEIVLWRIADRLDKAFYRWGTEEDHLESHSMQTHGGWESWGPDGGILAGFNPITNSLLDDNQQASREKHRPGTSAAEHVAWYYQHSDEMDHSLLWLRDLAPYLGEGVLGGDQRQLLIRRLRAFVQDVDCEGKTIIMSFPSKILPLDLEKDIEHFRFPLRDTELMRDLVRGVFEVWRDEVEETHNVQVEPMSEDVLARMARAAAGLTQQEANTALRRCLYDMIEEGAPPYSVGDAEVQDITRIKAEQIRKSGTMEYIHARGNMDDIGGMQNLKDWLRIKKSAINDPQDAPKGVLMLGIPGCGKSMMAKAVAGAWQLPLLQLKSENIFDQYVGNSERKISDALATAEAMAPCVLWIDEIEKLLAGSSGGGGDSGVAARLGGTLLNWLAEKRTAVFVVATANNPERLDPAYVRRGRFDERFFVDIPSKEVRWEIITKQYERRFPGSSGTLLPLQEDLISASHEFTGAEIETAIVEAKHRMMADGVEAVLSAASIVDSMKGIEPDARVRKEELDEIRKRWLTTSRNADIDHPLSSNSDEVGQ